MILVYHSIVTKPRRVRHANQVSLPALKRHLRALQSRQVVPLRNYDPANRNHVVLCFDDADSSLLLALPLLQQFGYPFSVFIVGDWFNTPGYLGESDIPAILAAGGNLQWHTNSHVNLADLPPQQVKQELAIPPAIRALAPDCFYALAYPFWQYTPQVAQSAAKAGFSCARSGNGFAPTAGGGGNML